MIHGDSQNVTKKQAANISLYFFASNTTITEKTNAVMTQHNRFRFETIHMFPIRRAKCLNTFP